MVPRDELGGKSVWGYAPKKEMERGGHRKSATGPGRSGAVPLDHYPREGPECGERRSREAARVERLVEGGMELVLHVGGCTICASKRVDDGPVFGAEVKCDEMIGPVVPRSAACGDSCNSGVPYWGKVMRASPPVWGLAHAKNLIDFWLP